MILFYSIIFALSLLMIPTCMIVDRKKNGWLLLLCIFIALSNGGHLSLALSRSLTVALTANAIAYCGSIFLPLCILMMVVKLANVRSRWRGNWLITALVILNLFVLFVATSGGYLDIYYKEVSFEVVDGVGHLLKVYGPLHVIYKWFIFGYFTAILAVILYSAIKKTAVSTKHSLFLALALLSNIVLWLIENILRVPYELLTVSYLMTEGMILLLYGILQDFEAAKYSEHPDKAEMIQQEDADLTVSDEISVLTAEQSFSDHQIRNILGNWTAVSGLTQREKEVLIFILEKRKRKDIAQVLFVTESTIKKHTSNIYKKLEVTSRAELFEKAAVHMQE